MTNNNPFQNMNNPFDGLGRQLKGRNLVRPTEGRMLFGVCAGLANYLKVDATIIRLAFVVLALVTAGVAVVAYLAGWLLIPEENQVSGDGTVDSPPFDDNVDDNISDLR